MYNIHGYEYYTMSCDFETNFFIIMSSSTSLEKKMEKQAEAMEGK